MRCKLPCKMRSSSLHLTKTDSPAAIGNVEVWSVVRKVLFGGRPVHSGGGESWAVRFGERSLGESFLLQNIPEKIIS